MDGSEKIREEQAKIWNGPAGRAWVDAQDILDGMFQPIANLLVDGVPAGSAEQVLDVGCGTGSTTLALARRLGANGGSVGVDISQPMLTLARERARREDSPARFICADAQVHDFAPATFDRIVSRFGVMFFGDAVAAFANLRRAAKPDARLQVIAWRGVAENPFMTTAENAAAPLLPELPPRIAGAAGQFAFAQRARVQQILADSGWGGVDIQPLDVSCSFPVAALDLYVARLGPVGALLESADDATRVQVMARVRAAYAPYVHGAEVRFPAACWNISARSPPR